MTIQSWQHTGIEKYVTPENEGSYTHLQKKNPTANKDTLTENTTH